MAALHESAGIEFPHFVSIRSEPLPGLVVRFIGETDRNPFFIKSPQLFDEAVVEFLRPLPGQEPDDFVSAVYKFIAIAPAAVESVPLGNFFGVTGVPVILGRAYL